MAKVSCFQNQTPIMGDLVKRDFERNNVNEMAEEVMPWELNEDRRIAREKSLWSVRTKRF